jgi:hypothetical protein
MAHHVMPIGHHVMTHECASTHRPHVEGFKCFFDGPCFG